MSFRKNERGATTVEYAIMLVLIALAVAALGQGIQESVTRVFSRMILELGQIA